MKLAAVVAAGAATAALIGGGAPVAADPVPAGVTASFTPRYPLWDQSQVTVTWSGAPEDAAEIVFECLPGADYLFWHPYNNLACVEVGRPVQPAGSGSAEATVRKSFNDHGCGETDNPPPHVVGPQNCTLWLVVWVPGDKPDVSAVNMGDVGFTAAQPK